LAFKVCSLYESAVRSRYTEAHGTLLRSVQATGLDDTIRCR
jgi:hypothetical protein